MSRLNSGQLMANIRFKQRSYNLGRETAKACMTRGENPMYYLDKSDLGFSLSFLCGVKAEMAKQGLHAVTDQDYRPAYES